MSVATKLNKFFVAPQSWPRALTFEGSKGKAVSVGKEVLLVKQLSCEGKPPGLAVPVAPQALPCTCCCLPSK